MSTVHICYYHEDTLASAVCTKCGKSICKNCSIKSENGNILCPDCINQKLYEQYKEDKRLLKERGGRLVKGYEFILLSAIGVIISLLFFLFVYCSDHSFLKRMLNSPEGIVAFVVMIFVLHCIPYGYIWITDRFAPKVDTVIGHIGGVWGKILISVLIGWICFIVYVIRFGIKSQRRY